MFPLPKIEKPLTAITFGWCRKDLESKIANGTINKIGERQDALTGRDFKERPTIGATDSQGARRNVMSTQGSGNGQRAQEGNRLARIDFNEQLWETRQGMEGSDMEEQGVDDQDGTIFDKTTKLYEDYKAAEGGIADQWARETSSMLHLDWQDHPTELSHYSHGDCGGLGFTSTMEKNLGMEMSNQAYQSHQQQAFQPYQQQAFQRTEPIPNQEWKLAGNGLVAAGTGLLPGSGVGDLGTAASETDGNLSSQPPDIKWDEWVNEDYDDEGYFHFR